MCLSIKQLTYIALIYAKNQMLKAHFKDLIDIVALCKNLGILSFKTCKDY